MSDQDKNDLPKPPEVNGASFQPISRAVSGTEINAGYIIEEYLSELQGTKGADVYDKMRRSDANILMILRAIKLPIRSAQWMINTLDDSEEAIKQKELFEHILFNDMGKPWTRFTGEALTFIDFGYSLFEVTHKPVLHHPKFGPYVGVKRLGFRKQTTIEKWKSSRDGELISVEQQADGDHGGVFQMDARFLLHFCPDQEGDNFEGISFLRGCYGPWFRKNLYLKLLAAGLEKYMIPTPKLKVPKDKENSPELEAALNVLRKYTSNQTNYLVFPDGWELDIVDVMMDPDKALQVIKYEDQSMANSFLAAFLILGQNNSGSYSLGSTLSDFFATAVQFIADHICEIVNLILLPQLVRLNFGSNDLKVELKVEGIKDSASTQYADLVQKLIQSGAITKDSDLEDYVREKFKLPAKKVEADLGNDLAPLQLAEGKGGAQAKLIRSGAERLREMIETGLTSMGVKYIEKLRRSYQGASESQRAKLTAEMDLTMPRDLVDILISLSMIQASQATDNSFKGKKLASMDDRMKTAESLIAELNEAVEIYENTRDGQTALKIGTLQRQIKARLAGIRKDLELSPKTIAKVRGRVETMANTQASDLKKKIDLQYQSSLGSTDSERTLFNDLEQARIDFQSSPVISAGPDILSSQNVNESILSETEGSEDVESYTFVAVDDEATSDICRELNGRTFTKDDPDLFRYSPPLHHNCRSYMMVNLTSFKNNPAVTKEPLELSKKAQGAITLSEDLRKSIFGAVERK